MTQANFLEGLPPRHHETVTLDETHQVNAQGLPEFHVVKQQIVAAEPMDTMPYIFDATAGEIKSVQANIGCTSGEPYAANPRYHVVDLRLDKPLQPGDRTTLIYTTFFEYETAPPPEYIRHIGRVGMEKLDITIRFEEEKLPQQLWWAAWQGITHESEAVPGTLELVDLTQVQTEGMESLWEAQRQQEAIAPGTILGFKWEW